MTIKKYIDNITSQHRDKPKFISWLERSIIVLDEAYKATKSVDINFDLDNAIGVQLDKLGIIIGRQRELSFDPIHGDDPVMNDEVYRLVLKTKVALNMWDGTIPHIYEIWDNIFKDIGLEIRDNQDMSFNAYIVGYVNQLRQDLIQRGYIVPKPEGVRINYIGKSIIKAEPKIAMVVNKVTSQSLELSFNPHGDLNFPQYPYLVLHGINKRYISMEEVE